MKINTSKKSKISLYKIIFALECGGGSHILCANSKNEVYEKIRKNHPESHMKIKTVEACNE